MLYALCTGKPPFRGPSTLAVLKRVCEETPRPIREINPEVPEWLCAIIARLHAKKPQDRFASAKEAACETTVAQFRAFFRETGYKTDAEKAGEGIVMDRDRQAIHTPGYTWQHPDVAQGDDYPVAQVSWNDAEAFCQWLGGKEHRTYRLPTEAEWEWAYRAGSEGAYCFGDDPKELGDYAWYDQNSDWKSHPVGRKKPNAWGLYDMHGNVAEFCQDWSDDLPSGVRTDPRGPAQGDLRVIRSYGFVDNAEGVQSDSCAAAGPEYSMFHFGFRVLCELPE